MISVILNEEDKDKSQFPVLLQGIRHHKGTARLTKKAVIELRNNLDSVISELDNDNFIDPEQYLRLCTEGLERSK